MIQKKKLCDVFCEEFFGVFFRNIPDTFVFVDANDRRLFAHALAFHFLNGDFFFESGFFNQILKTVFDFAVVSTAFFSVAEVNDFFRFFRLSHIQNVCANLVFNSYLF